MSAEVIDRSLKFKSCYNVIEKYSDSEKSIWLATWTYQTYFVFPQQSMSKKEIEDLLRKGAYGAIMEEENDDSSK